MSSKGDLLEHKSRRDSIINGCSLWQAVCYWRCNKCEITPWPSFTGEITFPRPVAQRENTSPRSVTDTVLLLERLLHKYVWQDLTGKSHSKVRRTQRKVLYMKGFFCWFNKCFRNHVKLVQVQLVAASVSTPNIIHYFVPWLFFMH